MPFLLDLRTKPITKLQSVNKSHHQTPICIETHHQTPISATETHHQTSIQPLTITDPTTKQSCNPSPTDPNSNMCYHQNSTTDADHHKPTPSTTPIPTNPRPPPHHGKSATPYAQKPIKKLPKRETHWFERGAWGIWVWVWVWAKSRDKESSRRLSTNIEGERRKGKNGGGETERQIWGRKRKRKRNPQAPLRQESFRELWSGIVVFWFVLGLIFCF